MIRVLIVDDSPFMRRAVARIVEDAGDMEVVGVAGNGREALDLLREVRPDVVTLDVMMPVMDGIQTLEAIMADDPVPVLMLSSITKDGASVTLEALEKGAVDFIDKPAVYTHMNMPTIAPELQRKIRAVAGVDIHRIERAGEHFAEPPAQHIEGRAVVDVVVIGCSTGGPQALSRIIPALPADFPVPIVVCQHMPAGFTAAMAQRLDATSQLEVREAAHGDLLTPGRVLVGKAGRQIHVSRRSGHLVARLDTDPPDTTHVPSVDVTFDSAAETTGHRTLGILLTGMGSDGAEGMLAIRKAGGHTIAEAASSAVVWGMPGSAVRLGAAEEVVDVHEIAQRVIALCVSPDGRPAGPTRSGAPRRR